MAVIYNFLQDLEKINCTSSFVGNVNEKLSLLVFLHILCQQKIKSICGSHFEFNFLKENFGNYLNSF